MEAPEPGSTGKQKTGRVHYRSSDGRKLLQAKCRLHNRTGLNFEFEIVLSWGGGVKQRDATITNEKALTNIGSPFVLLPLLSKWEFQCFW